MNEIYYYSPSSPYLRPAYPINTGGRRPSTRVPDPRSAHSTADGFVWLAKLLWNRWTQRRRSQGAVNPEPAPEISARRRARRLSLEVSAKLEQRAKPTTH